MSAQDTGSSYLSRLSPWSKSPSIAPVKVKGDEPEPLQQQQKGQDHVINHRIRLRLRDYPSDCPPMRPGWFHAVDVPKRRPNPAAGDKQEEEKPAATPKKYSAFSINDSKAIEAAYQRLVEKEDDVERAGHAEDRLGDVSLRGGDAKQRSDGNPNISLKDRQKNGKTVKVAVNEDYLFDVDVKRRELGPAYWLGPVYDVRRAIWYYQEGSVQRPCDENLGAQLEEGYLKVKAWKLPSADLIGKAISASKPRTRPLSWAPGQQEALGVKQNAATSLTPQPSTGDLRGKSSEQAPPTPQLDGIDMDKGEHAENTYRLFGSHMSSTVTYQDGTVAWLLTDDLYSRMNFSMRQRFAGSGHFAGMKMTRGYINPTVKPETKDEKPADSKDPLRKTPSEQSDGSPAGLEADVEDQASRKPSTSETLRHNLQRQMSSLMEDPSQKDKAEQDEEVRRRDEREIEDDYKEAEGDEQGRDIEHLILVTHGIGQRLGLRLESVNFVHDVNTLRKTIKAVYADSPDLRALNDEMDNSERVNSRIQVLPICWRHLLDFPKQSLKHNRKEHDLADTEVDDEEFPSLEDITVEGVPAVRNLITDLALDILLYQSPAYKDHISRIVLQECNRIYKLFLQRNPAFTGRVSFIGHSLGSAIMFDILCRQGKEDPHASKTRRKEQHDMHLDYEINDFYALGSPIGLFQMLKGKTIAGRPTPADPKRAQSGSMDDPMFDSPAPGRNGNKPTPANDATVSSPKCEQIFNIFHPTDPISYRIEPLISPAMAGLKPQPLPYTKHSIFGAPIGQGLTGIGTRVTQSVSSMWSGFASNLLTRGLGYSGDQGVPSTTKVASAVLAPPSLGTRMQSQGAGTNVSAGVVGMPVPSESAEIAQANAEKQAELASSALAASKSGAHPPTLIDSELETLYGGYQARRKSLSSPDSASRDLGVESSAEWEGAEERARKLKREEAKVRRLNKNGRVDYAIQEGVFESFNVIAAIASHLGYWSDEDVSHFIMSQLLSRPRVDVDKANARD